MQRVWRFGHNVNQHFIRLSDKERLIVTRQQTKTADANRQIGDREGCLRNRRHSPYGQTNVVRILRIEPIRGRRLVIDRIPLQRNGIGSAQGNGQCDCGGLGYDNLLAWPTVGVRF